MFPLNNNCTINIFLHLSMCHTGHIFLYNFWLTLPLPCEHGKCLSFTFTQIRKCLNPRYISLTSSIFLKFYIFTNPINTLNSYTTHYIKDILNQYTKLGIVFIKDINVVHKVGLGFSLDPPFHFYSIRWEGLDHGQMKLNL